MPTPSFNPDWAVPVPVRRRTLLRGLTAGIAAGAGCQGLAPSQDPTDPTRATDQDSAASTRSPGGLTVSWTSGPDMPLRRTQTTAVALDGRLYVIGGIVETVDRHTAVYDPADGRWRRAAPPPEPVNHTSAVAFDGRIHVFGGYTGSFLGGDPLEAHWIYDPAEDAWTEGPPLPTARGALVAVVVDGRIYTVGGATADGTTDRVEVYDPAEAMWTTAPSLPTPREHLAGGAVADRAYAAGGRQGLGPMVDATACFEPGGDAWESRTPMPTARAGIAGATLAGFLFVFGGEEVGEQVFGDVSAYDPTADTWTTVEPLPTPRWGLGAATLDGRIYTVGGGAVPSAEETRTLEIMSLG